jgi:tRNA-dihydrouridine synthase
LVISLEEKFRVLIEHARCFEQIKGVERFSAMRKHFGWYCKGFRGATILRNKMFQTKNSAEVEVVLGDFLSEFPIFDSTFCDKLW